LAQGKKKQSNSLFFFLFQSMNALMGDKAAISEEHKQVIAATLFPYQVLHNQ